MAVATVLFSTSCKKDEDEAVTIIGKWTLSEMGTDSNNNNKVDAGETAAASTVGLSGFLDFKSNNTFSASFSIGGMTETAAGTYTYANNSLTTVESGDTEVMTINSLTSNKLIIKNAAEGSGSATWEVYTK